MSDKNHNNNNNINKNALTLQILQRIEELSECTRDLKVSIERLDERIKLFSQRLDEAEQNIATLNARSYNCCPVHDQIVESFLDRINSIEKVAEKTREEFKDEIKFRDRLLYGILGTIIAQVIATIMIIRIK